MKYDKIRLISLSRVTVDLPHVGLDKNSKYILKAADGLGPPEFDVNIVDTLFQSGIYLGRRALGREVVLRVGLNPDWDTGMTPADLRSELYGLLEPRSDNPITISLQNLASQGVAMTEGVVKTFEISQYVKDPEVQITLGCFKPYLWSPVMKNSTTLDKTNPVMVTDGNMKTGFIMDLTFTAAVALGAFKITQSGTGHVMQIDRAFAIGDRLIINTIPGERSIKVIPNGGTLTEIVGYLSMTSKWIGLEPGSNTLTMAVTTYNWNNVQWRDQFWGV
jgi:hypothetical protein